MTWPRQRLYPLRSLTSWTESRSQSRPDRSSLRGKGLKLIGTALYNAPDAVASSKNCEATPHGRRNGVKAVRRVVWDPGANYSRGPDSALFFRRRISRIS